MSGSRHQRLSGVPDVNSKRPSPEPGGVVGTLKQDKRPSGRDEVIDALLDAARRLVASQGPFDISLRGVAREANVNHGLIYRYFGTRADLVDQLLQHLAVLWTVDAESSCDLLSALELILGVPSRSDDGIESWLRVLAWSFLAVDTDHNASTRRRHAKLDLPTAVDAEREQSVGSAAAALALVLGWRFFHPYILDALDVDDSHLADLHESIRTGLRHLVSAQPATAHTCSCRSA